MYAKSTLICLTLSVFAASVSLAGPLSVPDPAASPAVAATPLPRPTPGTAVVPAVAVTPLATAAPGAAVTPAPAPTPIANDVVAPGAELKKVGTGFVFVEGPAASPSGDIYFSDVDGSRTYKWSPKDGTASVYLEDSNEANGLMFDKEGRLVACHQKTRCITRDDLKGNITVLADKYEGKRFNSPNDLWMDPKGGIYFSDPRYGKKMDDLEQDGFHVYYISPDGKKVTRVTSDLKRPNGLVGTPDGKTLYIADPGQGAPENKKTWRYKINPDGTFSDKTLFVEGGSDGMKMDERGNLYLGRKNIEVFDPKGNKIREIAVPETPANLTFGGPDRKTLFITATTSVYTIQMAVRGVPAAFER